MQVFAVRSGGATGITVKGPTERDTITFCMEDKGSMRSIKFSPDMKILAVQRTETSVEFINFIGNQPNVSEVILHKSKSSLIHGFVWLQNREVVFISNSGVEIYSINVEKKNLKSIKSMNLNINWFSWCAAGNLAVLATSNSRILMPTLIRQGLITKLPKLECKIFYLYLDKKKMKFMQIFYIHRGKRTWCSRKRPNFRRNLWHLSYTDS